MKLMVAFLFISGGLFAQSARPGDWITSTDGPEFRAMALADLPISQYAPGAPACECTHLSIRDSLDSTAYRVTVIYRSGDHLAIERRTVKRWLQFPALTEVVFQFPVSAVRSISVTAIKELGTIAAEY